MKEKKPHEEGVCPICSSKDLNYGSIELERSSLGYPWHCNNCNSTGTEWYNLTFIGHENIEEWEGFERRYNNGKY